jgi:hypothetical protein
VAEQNPSEELLGFALLKDKEKYAQPRGNLSAGF